MSQDPSTANRTTQEFINSWQSATDRLERLRRDLSSAEMELTRTTNELGKQMVPSDAKEGEEFCIWTTLGADKYAANLLVVRKVAAATYKITTRSR